MNAKNIFLVISSMILLSACPGKDARRVNPILNAVPPQGRQTVFRPEERLRQERESTTTTKTKTTIKTKTSSEKKLRFEKITKPYFYVLKKNEKKVYVLGTMHSGVDYNELPIYILDLLRTANVSIHEANVLDITTEQINRYVKLEGQKLSDVISAKAFENVSKVLAQDYRQDQIEQMHPWFAAGKYKGACATSSDKGPLDVQLEKFAKEAKVKSVPLEEFEIRMKEKELNSWNRSLEMSCWYIDSAFDSLLKLYKAGDLQKTVKDAQASGMEDPDDTELVQRNRNWMPIILESIRDIDTAFIYVGAAHLRGEESVLNLLSREGFSVERCSDRACP